MKRITVKADAFPLASGGQAFTWISVYTHEVFGLCVEVADASDEYMYDPPAPTSEEWVEPENETAAYIAAWEALLS